MKHSEEINQKISSLASENAFYRHLSENIPDIFFAFDKNFRLTFWNKASEKLTGTPSEKALGKTLFELFPKTPGIKKIEIFLKKVLKTGNADEIEYALSHPNADDRLFLIKAFPANNSIGVIASDITQFKIYEDELQLAEVNVERSEQQLKLITSNVPVLIARINANERYVFVNATFEKVFGKSPEEIIGIKVKEIIGEKAYAIAQPFIKQTLEGKNTSYENTINLKNGKPATFLATNVPEFAGKQVIGYFFIAIDITERRQAEEEIERSHFRFRSMIDVAPFGAHTYELLPDNRLIFTGANQSANNILHVNNEHFIGKAIEDAFPNLAGTDIPDLYRNVARTGEPFNREEITYSDDQGIAGAFEIWAFQTAANKMAVLLHDITEKKRQEEALRQSKVLYTDLVETAQDLIWQCDAHGRYTYLNPAWEEVLGYKVEEMLCKKFTDFQSEEWANRDLLQFSSLLHGNNIKGLETVHLAKNGQEVHLLFNAKVIRDLKGNTIGSRGTAYNITERKQFEKELIKAKEQAEESDRLKTAFLQNMSHEIRTPLNAIMGFSSLLSSNFENKEKLTSFSEIIERRSSDLLDIIDSILNISRIESGQMALYPEDCNLADFFRDLELYFSEYRKRMNKQHLFFSIACADEVSDLIIVVDKVKLRQVLTNLIGNAFKFTASGTIEVGCSLKRNNVLLFYVSDTGIGIPADKHNEIFKRFRQASYDTSFNYGGTGLGLSIVKGLLNMLEGEIWLESKPGAGSTFYFTIPVKFKK